MLSVLLVDDEPSIRLAMGDALAREGYDVSRASDGVEALRLCAQRTFDLIITDMHMPGLDGIGVLRQVRAISPKTEVLLMTVLGREDDLTAAFRLGVEDMMSKPFTADELLTRVAEIASKRRLLSEA